MTSLHQRYPGQALITGASSGIGEQFARTLARDGMDLVLLARREAELIKLQQELEATFDVKVSIICADLSDAQKLPALITQLLSMDISLLISNAGFGIPKGSYVDADWADMSAMWQVNSLSPAQLAHAFAQAFKQRDSRTAMLFTGSIEGEAAFPYSSAYAASKAFLHSLAYGLSVELRRDNIDVLLLAPGATDTNAPISQGISRDQLAGLMTPAAVAEQALQKLGKTTRYIPGLHNRVFIRLLRALPVKIASAMTGWGMLQAMRKSKL